MDKHTEIAAEGSCVFISSLENETRGNRRLHVLLRLIKKCRTPADLSNCYDARSMVPVYSMFECSITPGAYIALQSISLLSCGRTYT